MSKRSFNITGMCVPDTDYMIDISGRVEKVKKMVDQGNYFAINRPRQYGKTTLIDALSCRLSAEYVCALISFEGLGDESFENAEKFCNLLMSKIRAALKDSAASYDTGYIASWMNPDIKDFISLNEHITEMCSVHKVVRAEASKNECRN